MIHKAASRKFDDESHERLQIFRPCASGEMMSLATLQTRGRAIATYRHSAPSLITWGRKDVRWVTNMLPKPHHQNLTSLRRHGSNKSLMSIWALPCFPPSRFHIIKSTYQDVTNFYRHLWDVMAFNTNIMGGCSWARSAKCTGQARQDTRTSTRRRHGLRHEHSTDPPKANH